MAGKHYHVIVQQELVLFTIAWGKVTRVTEAAFYYIVQLLGIGVDKLSSPRPLHLIDKIDNLRVAQIQIYQPLWIIK